HQYQRTDSVWANDYVINSFDEMRQGLKASRDRVLPANIIYDLGCDKLIEVNPPTITPKPLPPETFGDHWGDLLDRAESLEVEGYIRRIETLRDSVDFVTFRVGGREHVIQLTARGFKRGIIFEVPRKSLL